MLWNTPCLLIGLGISWSVISLDEDSCNCIIWIGRVLKLKKNYGLAWSLSALLSPIYIFLMSRIKENGVRVSRLPRTNERSGNLIFFPLPILTTLTHAKLEKLTETLTKVTNTVTIPQLWSWAPRKISLPSLLRSYQIQKRMKSRGSLKHLNFAVFRNLNLHCKATADLCKL